MRLWKTIVVIILLAIIGGYALYTAKQPAPDKTPKLYTIAANDIKKLELKSPDHDIVLERGAGGKWNLLKPIKTAADRTTIDGIADAIASLQITGTADDRPTDLAPFGLANPAVVITVTTNDNRVLPAIMVGKNTPIGDSAYIKTSDKPAVLLVANVFPAQVNKSLDDVRSHELFSLKTDDVRKVVIDHDGNGPSLELERDGDKWVIVKPIRYPADNDVVHQFIEGVTNAHVNDFISENPTDLANYGLSNPSLRIKLYGGANGTEESLLFGFKQPEAYKNAIYVQRGEGNERPVCTIAEYVFNDTNFYFKDLRDKYVLLFDPSKVERVVITGDALNGTLERAPGGKWNMTSDGKTAPVETPVAESLLSQLHDLKATRIAEDPMSDPKRYGMVNPELTIRLYAKDGKEIGTVRTATVEETITPAQSNAKPQHHVSGYAITNVNNGVCEIPDQIVENLVNTASHLRSDVVGTPTPSAGAGSTNQAQPVPSLSPSASPAASAPPAASANPIARRDAMG